MFKKFVNSIKDAINPPRYLVNQPSPSNQSNRISQSCSPANKVDYHMSDQAFIIDFVSIRGSDETIKKAEVRLPANNQYIIINGDKEYFDCYYVNNEGLSSDKLYYRVATPDFKFWIYPRDLARFMSIAEYRHELLIENRKRRDEAVKIDIYTPFDYDQITDEIYKCFIANKTGMCDAIGTWGKLNKVEDRIAMMCQENNGKYYKTPAKTARYAIIFDPHSRTFSNVNSLKEKGYRVSTFEKALVYFGLNSLWDCESMIRMENEHKEFMRNNNG